MNALIKVNPTPEGFAYIVEKCMADAFSSKGDREQCVQDYAGGHCELWTVPKHGFIVVAIMESRKRFHDFDRFGNQVNTTKFSRYLEVQYGAGKVFYNRKCIALLDKMAAGYSCSKIVAYTVKPGVVRLLVRQGFKVTKTSGAETVLQKAVEYGQQIQKQNVVGNEHYNDDRKQKRHCKRFRFSDCQRVVYR